MSDAQPASGAHAPTDFTLCMSAAQVGQVRRPQSTPMRSLVNWMLLGLVMDRPSYAYELAQRFERTFGDELSLSSVSHVYTALGTLKERELIEELPGTRAGRQPKPHYRATEKGIGEYQRWLTRQVIEDRQRQRLFVLALGALAQRPQAALEIMEHYEQTYLQEARQGSIPSIADVAGQRTAELVSALIGEESRLVVAAKLAWARYARAALSALPAAKPRTGVSRRAGRPISRSYQVMGRRAGSPSPRNPAQEDRGSHHLSAISDSQARERKRT